MVGMPEVVFTESLSSLAQYMASTCPLQRIASCGWAALWLLRPHRSTTPHHAPHEPPQPALSALLRSDERSQSDPVPHASRTQTRGRAPPLPDAE